MINLYHPQVTSLAVMLVSTSDYAYVLAKHKGQELEWKNLLCFNMKINLDETHATTLSFTRTPLADWLLQIYKSKEERWQHHR